ncbi:hypothetical protein [Crateriforma conspicua]|uniref:Uncharacterized protein n=1 Tax=Crateriforma conspicua TaxID=2527996 RepID=A0A5C6FSB7_9PLAN|nr:hypothetical protein [Crateriforma conspicua]TWU65927.1 hypothetical protein V7x_14810 [Crateriforma conspicua]
MHARPTTNHLHWCLILIVVVLSGCRGTRPLGGWVQVKAEPTGDLPAIEPPPQRLAKAAGAATATTAEAPGASQNRLASANMAEPPTQTASVKTASPASPTGVTEPSDTPQSSGNLANKAASGTRRTERLLYQKPERPQSKVAAATPVPAPTGEADSGQPPAEQVAAAAATPTTPDAKTTSESTATSMRLSDQIVEDLTQGDAPKKVAATTELSGKSTTENSPESGDDSVAKNTTDDTSSKIATAAKAENAAKDTDAQKAAEAEDALDAFANSPPEIQQQALRHLITLAVRDANRTSQPASIDDLLLQAMSDPVDLPEPRRTPSPMQTTRIASPGTQPAATMVAQTPPQADDAAPKPDPVVAPESLVNVDNAPSASATPSVQPVGSVDDKDSVDSVELAVGSQPMPEPTKKSGNPADSVQSAVAQVSNALLSDDALYDMLIRRLGQAADDETEAQKHRREIITRHLLVLAGKPDAAVEGIEGLTREEQEYLRHQLMGLWTIIDPAGHPVPSRRFHSALPQMREGIKHLAASTDSLEVKSMAFCTAVDWYGQYKEFDEAVFKPEADVILYCEVDNFTAKQVGEGYETHLQGSYTIYNAENRKVLSQLLPADKQVSRNYLRDYFIAYGMKIPTALTAGKYRLELTMEDLNGKKYGQSSIDFEVKASKP